MSLHRPLILLLCAASSWLASTAQAAPWYRVEVMLVAYSSENLMGYEHWPQAISQPITESQYPNFDWWLNPSPIDQYRALWANFGIRHIPQQSLSAPFNALETLHLSADAQRINARKDMKVVFHQAWIEPIGEQQHAVLHPIDVRVQNGIDIHLVGHFSLYRSRFLHFNTDLTIQHYQPAALPSLADLLPESEQSDVRSDYRSDLLTQAAIEMSSAEEHQPLPLRGANIKQSRRMRSGELHYVDHPLLGAVVRVIPITDAASAR